MRLCLKCDGNEFYKSGRCAPCERARLALLRKADPEKERMRRAAKYLRRRERERAYYARYCEQNPEKTRLRKQRYRTECAEKVKTQIARWTAKNRDKVNATAARRRAAKKAAIPEWTSDFDIFAISEAYALARMRTLLLKVRHHVDHVVPLQSKSVCGFHLACNLQVIPGRANWSKGNFYWPDKP